MAKFATRALLAALMSGTAGAAFAADLYEPPVVEAPPPEVVVQEVSYGGWYIRGDLDYHRTDMRGAEYYTYGHNPEGDLEASLNGELDGDLDDSWSAGAGVGYQVSKHLRTDVTIDHFGEADFEGSTEGFCIDEFGGSYGCTSSDKTSLSAWLLLANAYAELGTYHGFTPYVGAGIGGAHIEWDKLRNSVDGVETVTHDGAKEWRFAYALMAGTSYCLTKNLNLDLGYRFSHIEGGKMFDYARTSTGGPDIGAGPGYDDGFNVHEVRGGLRYQFGAGNPSCGEEEVVAYEPEPAPVYK